MFIQNNWESSSEKSKCFLLLKGLLNKILIVKIYFDMQLFLITERQKSSLFVWRISKAAMLGKEQRSWDRPGGARSPPFGVLMSQKRRVRAAHGRAREAKTH